MGNDEIIRLVLQTQGAEGLKTLAQEARSAAKELEATGTVADKAAKSTGNSAQSMLQIGRVIQDFTQGGFGGILNNIEGLTAALGLGAGLAGVATIAGTALFIASPKIKGFFQALIDGANEVPQATDRLDRLTEAMGKNKKELDELKDKQSLTNTELARYNELLGQQEKLEKDVDAAKKAKADADALAKLKRADQKETEQAIARDLTDAFGGGGQNEILARVKDQFAKDDKEVPKLQDELRYYQERGAKEIANARTLTEENAIRAANKKVTDAIEAKIKDRRNASDEAATSLVADAFTRGNNESLKKLISMMPEGRQRGQMESLTAESRSADETSQAAFDEAIADRQDQVKKRNESVAWKQRKMTDAMRVDEHASETAASEAAREKAKTDAMREAANREKARQEAEAERETARLREQAAHEAPKRAEAAQLARFGQGVQQVAAETGIQLNPDQVLQGAKTAVDLARKGVETNEAIMGGFMDLMKRYQDAMDTLGRQSAQMGAMRQQMGAMPVWSQTPDMWP